MCGSTEALKGENGYLSTLGAANELRPTPTVNGVWNATAPTNSPRHCSSTSSCHPSHLRTTRAHLDATEPDFRRSPHLAACHQQRSFHPPTTLQLSAPLNTKSAATFPWALVALKVHTLAPASVSRDTPRPENASHHPRVASALGVDRRFHIPLIICRGLSVCPSILGLARCALIIYGNAGAKTGCLALELWLAALWCGVAAYMGFMFTNNLMARWLIYYTPAATLVRLFSISALNSYLTSWALAFICAGDVRMLLPSWVFVSLVLTICYHTSQRSNRPGHEVTPAIYVLCVVSFASMCVLIYGSHVCSVWV